MDDFGKLNERMDSYEGKTDERFDKVLEKIDIIKDNHLAHMQADMNVLAISAAKTTTNVDWLLRYHWIIATASIGALVAGIINLMK